MSAELLSNVVSIAPVTEELAPKDESPAEKTERDVYRLIEANLGLLGGIQCAADIMGVDRGDLRRALDGGKGRYLAVEHVMRFCDRLREKNPDAAQRIAVALMRPFDCVVAPRIQFTAAEQARRFRNMLTKIGASMGVDLVRQALEAIE